MANPNEIATDLNLAKILLRQLVHATYALLEEFASFNAELPSHPQAQERARVLKLSLRNSTKFLQPQRTKRTPP